MEVLSKGGAQGKELGSRRDYLSSGALGKSYLGFTLTCESAGCCLVHGLLSGHALEGEASVSSRPL